MRGAEEIIIEMIESNTKSICLDYLFTFDDIMDILSFIESIDNKTLFQTMTTHIVVVIINHKDINYKCTVTHYDRLVYLDVEEIEVKRI